MSENQYLAHVDKIQKILANFDSPKSYVFAAACLERLWPVYEKASQKKKWANQKFYRKFLDHTWEWLLDKKKEPQRYAKKLAGMIIEEIIDDADSAASEVSISFSALAEMIEEGDWSEISQVPQSNLWLLDSFIYELLALPVTKENDAKVNNHELMQAEMKHQVYDLDLLQNNLTTVLIKEIRERSFGKSVLGEYWFNLD